MTTTQVLIADDDTLFGRAIAIRNMPGQDGIAVREWMLEAPELRQIPVIFLTGRSDPSVLAQCRSADGEHVVKGPRAWSRLRPMICQHLGVRDPAVDQRPARPQAGSGGAEGAKVLIVDDDQGMVEALKLRLLSRGYQPLVAYGGQAAYDLALRQEPDVIITDNNMPAGSGDDLLARIADSATLDIPVIVITGQTIDGREDHHLQRDTTGRLGAAAFLQKPLDMALLLRTVDELALQSSLKKRAKQRDQRRQGRPEAPRRDLRPPGAPRPRRRAT